MPEAASQPAVVKRRGPSPLPTPLYRPLKAYAFDPARGRGLGNHMTINTRYEDLKPGPVGSYLAVVDYDGANDCYYEPVDLNQPGILINDGMDPSESDPRFHQQMVYAVASETISRFEFALGRKVHWRRDTSSRDTPFHNKLRLFPHAIQEANAYYDPSVRGILFGYFAASDTDPGANLPGQTIFTCLSHDIIAHETTHAIVDGIRSFFMEPTSIDTPAFHEAFADVIALFQHFSMKDALLDALRGTRGMLQRFTMSPTAQAVASGATVVAELPDDNPLILLAKQFGDAMGMRAGLRSALGTPPNSTQLQTETEPHTRGSILVAAIFDAFFSVYLRRTKDLWRIAHIGPENATDADLHPDLLARLAAEVSKSANQFCNICIRALDYCPPVDIHFGDYLRAIITADYDLVPDDDLGYREALIQSFRARGIRPSNVASLSEESLLWDRPDFGSAGPVSCEGLQTSFPPNASYDDIRAIESSNAQKLTDFAKKYADAFGLDPALGCDIPSFHPIRRVGPDGQLRIEMVAQVIQKKPAQLNSGGASTDIDLLGGATLIFDPDGLVRYAIRKSLKNEENQQRQAHYKMQMWERSAESAYTEYTPGKLNFRAIHRGY